MEKDLNILRKIFKDLHFTNSYSDLLIEYIIKKFNESGLTHMTPSFIFNCLAYDEGKESAKKISEYFQEMKETGDYTSIVDRIIKNYK